MRAYVSPSAELIAFGNEKIMTSSTTGCNCFADRWNNTHDLYSGCEGISYDFSEILWSE